MPDYNKKNIRTWSLLGMRRCFSVVLEELAEADEKFIFVTADVSRYYAINQFIEKYPERIVNVGIAEQNMIGVAAGLAKEGFHPMVATYATFATSRVLDQIRVNMGLMKLGIVVVGVSSGLAEGDMSATHMGLEDIANIAAIPNITILSPADCIEAVKVMLIASKNNQPTYIRLSGISNCPIVYKHDYNYEVGKCNKLQDGCDCMIVATGSAVALALQLSIMFKQLKNLEVAVYNMSTIKPIDRNMISDLVRYENIVTIEEHGRYGGIGSIIETEMSEMKRRPRHLIIGINDYYPSANEYKRLLQEVGLSKELLFKRISEFIG